MRDVFDAADCWRWIAGETAVQGRQTSGNIGEVDVQSTTNLNRTFYIKPLAEMDLGKNLV